MSDSSRLFRFYSVLVCVAALGGMTLAWSIQPPVALPVLAMLLVATLLAENLAVSLPGGGSASVSYPLSLAAILLGGPATGGIVAAFSGLNLEDIRNKKPPFVIVFNVAQLVLTAAVSGLWYRQLGGRPLMLSAAEGYSGVPLSAADFPHALGPIAVMTAVSFLLNVCLVALAIGIYYSLSPATVARRNLVWLGKTQLPLAILGLAIAEVVAAVGIAGLVLFVFPLIAAQQVYQRYSRLKVTYMETLQSLAAALEAKDPYTMGHSERVAEYSVATAQALGLSEDAVERVRTAALLHDLGKVGVSSRILNKPGCLDEQERQEIRRHPEIGVDIISAIPFLRPALPAVQYHHERVDGFGYGCGRAGDEIPLDARILAVADSYDAMTSRRSYKEPLSQSEAIRELEAGRGSQFDPAVVDAFLQATSESA